MFEGWAAELLATSLGRFVDVQRDRLRISLWSGSGVLENVRLRAEAFDYLKLPFAVHEGVVGRLRIKIPWGNWLTGSLVVELSDVLLCTTEREDSEWEEPAALRRDQAAKQADLAAAELAKLSRRMAAQQQQQQQQAGAGSGATGAGAAPSAAGNSEGGGKRQGPGGSSAGGAPPGSDGRPPAGSSATGQQGAQGPGGATREGAGAAGSASEGVGSGAGGGAGGGGTAAGSGGFGGGLWGAAVQYLTHFILNRLQFSVRNVHITFRGRQDGRAFAAGVALDSLSTVPEPRPPRSVLSRLYGASLGRTTVRAAARLARHISVQGLRAYWSTSPRGSPHSSRRAALANPQPPLPLDDYVVRPLDLSLRVTLASGVAPTATVTPTSTSSSTSGAPLSTTGTAGAGEASGANASFGGARQSQAGAGGGATGQSGAGAAAGAAASPSSAASCASSVRLEVVVGCEALHVQLRAEQLQSMMKLADDLVVWNKRNRYGRFRPPGWCTAVQMQRVLEDARADRLEQLARMQQQHHHQGQLDKRISLGGAIGAGAAVRGSLDEGASEAPGGLGSLVRSSSDPGGIAAAAAALELGVGLQSVDEEREGVGKGGSSSGRVVEGGGQLPGGGGTSGTGAGGAGGAREAAGRLLARQRSGSTGSGTGVSRLANGSGGGGGGLSVELPTYRVQAVRSALPSPRFGAGGKTASVGALAGIEGVGAAQRWGRAPIPAAPVHAGPPTWVHVWQYAGRAVLHDLRERRTAWSLRDYLHNKGHYTRLYRRKLEHLRHGDAAGGGAAGVAAAAAVDAAPLSAAEVVELQRLEADLPIADILTFRALTERALEMEEQERERERERQRAQELERERMLLLQQETDEEADDDEEERDEEEDEDEEDEGDEAEVEEKGDEGVVDGEDDEAEEGVEAAAGRASVGGEEDVPVPSVSGSSGRRARKGTVAAVSPAVSDGARAAAAAAGSCGGGGGSGGGVESQRRSWIAWGMSGISGFFTYGSSSSTAKAAAAAQVSQPMLTDAELAELYRLLHGTSLEAAVVAGASVAVAAAAPGGSAGGVADGDQAAANGGAMPLSLQLRILHVTLDILGARRTPSGDIGSGHVAAAAAAAAAPKLLTVALHSTAVGVESDGRGVSVVATVGTATAFDCFTDPGVAECILWQADDAVRQLMVAHEQQHNAAWGVATPGPSSSPFAAASVVPATQQQQQQQQAADGKPLHASRSWGSLVAQLFACSSRSSLRPSASTDSLLDADGGHWAMGATHTTAPSLASRPSVPGARADASSSTWHVGTPVITFTASPGDPAVRLRVRPLRLLYRPGCMGAVSAAMVADESFTGSLDMHIAHAIRDFESREAQLLAKLQLLGARLPGPGQLRVEVEGLEVILAVNEPPPAPTSTTASKATVASPSALPNSSVPSPNPLGRTGHLVVGLYGMEVATQAEPPPANVLQVLAPMDAAFSDAQSPPPAGVSPCGDGGMQVPHQQRPDVPQLQRLLRRGLSPCSTAPDLLALAAGAAPALGVAAGLCPGGSDGAHGDATMPGCSATHGTGNTAADATAVLDVVEQAFLYAHWQLRARDLRAAYVPPPSLPPANFQPSGSSPGREPTSARGQQPQQQDQLLRPLLPCGMGLCGVYSRSKAPLDGTAPKQYVRLGLSGLSGALCASQLAELQRIGGLIGSGGDAPAETQESKPQGQQEQQEAQQQRQDRPGGAKAAAAERSALVAGVSAGETAGPSGPRIVQRLSYADAVRASAPSDAASASAPQHAPSRGPQSPSVASGTPAADAPDLPRYPSTSSPSSSSLSSFRGPTLARTSSAMLRLPLLAPTTVLQLAVAPLDLTYVANEGGAEQPAPAQSTDRGGNSSNGSSVTPPFTLRVRASRPLTVALTAGPAGSRTSVKLHGLELHSPCVQQQLEQQARPPGMVLRLLSLARTLCIKSVSLELRRPGMQPGGKGGMAVWGSLCGLRLLGQLPSSFLLSNGAGQDDARVLFRYWGAGAEPPGLPEVPPEGASGTGEAQSTVPTQACAGGDKGVLLDGCGDGGGGGLELVVSDLAVGLGFLTALPAALSSGEKPPVKGAAEAAGEGQLQEQEKGLGGDAHAPVQQARRRRPSTPRARVDAGRGDAESGWPHAGSATVRESPFATSQRAADADADTPSGGDMQRGLAFGSSGGAAGGESTDEEDAVGNLGAGQEQEQEQEQEQGEPFWTRVRLSNCCVLALGPSRTPFAAASGSGHQACNALLLLDSATLTSPPPPPPPAHQPQSPPQPPHAPLAPASAAGVAHVSPEAVLVEELGIGEDHTCEQPHVPRASRPRSGQLLEVEGLVVYLADSPDSAYLSPVVLLPSLNLRHLPAAATDEDGNAGSRSSSGGADGDSGPGVDTPRVGGLSGHGVGAAVTAEAAEEEEALGAMSPVVNLQVRVPVIEAGLQPQQAGVLCALLKDLQPPSAPPASPPDRQQPMRQGASSGAGQAGAGGGAAGGGLPAALPRMSASVELGSLTALLGSDALSEEATAVYWRGVRLTFNCTGSSGDSGHGRAGATESVAEAETEASTCLAWRELTVASLASRGEPAAAAGAGAATAGGSLAAVGAGGPASAAGGVGNKIHAESLAILCELSSWQRHQQQQQQQQSKAAANRPGPAGLPGYVLHDLYRSPTPAAASDMYGAQDPMAYGTGAPQPQATHRALSALRAPGAGAGGGGSSTVGGRSRADSGGARTGSRSLQYGGGRGPAGGAAAAAAADASGMLDDAEFFSVEGGSSNFDADVDMDLGAELQGAGREQLPPEQGALPWTAGDGLAHAAGADASPAGSSVGGVAGRRRGLALPLHASSGTSIANLAALPGVRHLPYDTENAAAAAGGHGYGGGQEARVAAAAGAVVLLSAGAIARQPGAAGLSRFPVGAAPLTSIFLRISVSECRNRHPRHHAVPPPVSTAPPPGGGASFSAGGGGGRRSGSAASSRRASHEWVRGVHAAAHSGTHSAHAASLSAAAHTARAAAAAGGVAAGRGKAHGAMQQGNGGSGSLAPHLDLDVSGLHVLVSTTQWKQLADSVAACGLHWQTAEQGHARVAQQQQQHALRAGEVPAAQQAPDQPQAAADSTATGDPLALLLRLPVTAHVSMEDISLVAYAAAALPSHRTAAAPAFANPVPGALGALVPAGASHKPCPQPHVPYQAAPPPCVRISCVVGASLESTPAGGLDRMTLALPEVCISTGELVLTHDPRVGTWHSVGHSWRLLLLEGLSCAAVPQVRSERKGSSRGDGRGSSGRSGGGVGGSSSSVSGEERESPKAAVAPWGAEDSMVAAAGVHPAGLQQRGVSSGGVLPASPAQGVDASGETAGQQAPLADATAAAAGMAAAAAVAAAVDHVHHRRSLNHTGSHVADQPAAGTPHRSSLYGMPDSSGAETDGRATGTHSSQPAPGSIVVHALLEASVQHVSVYGARRALLALAQLAYGTQDHWAAVAAAKQQRRAAGGAVGDEEEDAEGATTDEDEGVPAGGAAAPALGPLVAAAGLAAAAAATPVRRGLGHPAGSGLERLQEEGAEVDEDADGEEAGRRRRGGDAVYQTTYHVGLLGRSRRHSWPAGATATAAVAAAGGTAPQGPSFSGEAGCVGAGAAGGVLLPWWLPLCCLTIKVSKAAAVLYTDLQGYELPLFEAAVSPLELQVKLLAASASAACTAAAAGPPSPTPPHARSSSIRGPAPSSPTHADRFSHSSPPRSAVGSDSQPPTPGPIGTAPHGRYGTAAAPPGYAAHLLPVAAPPPPARSFRFPSFSRRAASLRLLQYGSAHTPPAVVQAAAPVASLHVVLDAVLLLDVYNLRKLGWEPVVEPWAVQLLYTGRAPQPLLPRSTPPVQAQQQPQHSVNISTRTVLDATLSPGLIPAAAAAAALTNELQRTLSPPKPTPSPAASRNAARSHTPPPSSSAAWLPHVAPPTAPAAHSQPQTQPAPASSWLPPPQPHGSLPRLWLQKHVGMPLSYFCMDPRVGHVTGGHVAHGAAAAGAGLNGGGATERRVLYDGALVLLDSVQLSQSQFAGRHVSSRGPGIVGGPAAEATYGAGYGYNAMPSASESQRSRTGREREGHASSSHAPAPGAAAAAGRSLYFRLEGHPALYGPVPYDAPPGTRLCFPLSGRRLLTHGSAAVPSSRAGALSAGVVAPVAPWAGPTVVSPAVGEQQQLQQAAEAHLVCEVRPHQLCSRRLEVRSNIRLRNESGVALLLGDWCAVQELQYSRSTGGGRGMGGMVAQAAQQAQHHHGRRWHGGVDVVGSEAGAAAATAATATAVHHLPAGAEAWLSASALLRQPVVLSVRAACTVDVHAAQHDTSGGAEHHAEQGTAAAGAGGDGGTARCTWWSGWSGPLDLTSMISDAALQQQQQQDGGGGAASAMGVARNLACTLLQPTAPASEGAPVSRRGSAGGGAAPAAPAAVTTCNLIAHLVPVPPARGTRGSYSTSPCVEWELVILSPAVVVNQLPVPLRFCLHAYASGLAATASPSGGGAATSPKMTHGSVLPAAHANDVRGSLDPVAAVHLHANPARRLTGAAFRPVGYTWSANLPVFGLPQGTRGGSQRGGVGSGQEGEEEVEPLHPGLEEAAAGAGGADDSAYARAKGGGGRVVRSCEVAVPLRSTQPGYEDLVLVVRTWRHRPTGQVRVEVGCPVWVYNCLGLPVSLRPTVLLMRHAGGNAGGSEGGASRAGGFTTSSSSSSSGSWVPPCLSSGGTGTLAPAAGPCTSQLAALQAAAGLFRGGAGGGSVGGSSGSASDRLGPDGASSSGGCMPGVATVRSSSSVRSGRSLGGHTVLSSSTHSGASGVMAGHGGTAAGLPGRAGGLGSAGLLAALADGDPRVGVYDSTDVAAGGGSGGGYGAEPGGAQSPTRAGTTHALSRHASMELPQQYAGGLPVAWRRQAVRAGVVGLPAGSTASAGGSAQAAAWPDPMLAPAAGGEPAAGVDGAPAVQSQPSSHVPSPAVLHGRGSSSGGRTSTAAAGSAGTAAPASAANATCLQPCLYGNMVVGAPSSQLELCVWHGGSGTWSAPVWPELDGSPVLVTLPCPLPDNDGGIYAGLTPPGGAGGARSGAGAARRGGGSGGGRPAFHVVARLTRVGGVPRAVALHLTPRYVVHNGLASAVQLRQQGTTHTCSLGPGERRPVHWADTGLPLRLQLRVRDPGWSWSGGVALDDAGPGDLFLKIRHRNRGETQLVRVDVGVGADGTLLASLSHHHTDFAPYRIDNCSGEQLHVQQVGCLDQEDVVRPYACLPYTWDEHTAPQRVLVSLQGRRRLGEFELEQVGFSTDLNVVSSQTGGHGRRRLRVSIHADGPTRVLRVVDLAVHPVAPANGGAAAAASAGRHHGGGTSGAASRRASGAAADLAADSDPWVIEVTASVAGVAVSVVSEREELLYALLQGAAATLRVGGAKVALSASLQHVRWDNCLRGAVFPIMVYSPVGRTLFNTAVLLPPPPLPAEGRTTTAAAAATGSEGRQPLAALPAGGVTDGGLATVDAQPSQRGLSLWRRSAHGASPAAGAQAGGAGPGGRQGPLPPAALSVRAVVWRNRPGGVTCVQQASLTAAPMLVSVEEVHVRELLGLVTRLRAAAAVEEEAGAGTASVTSGPGHPPAGWPGSGLGAPAAAAGQAGDAAGAVALPRPVSPAARYPGGHAALLHSSGAPSYGMMAAGAPLQAAAAAAAAETAAQLAAQLQNAVDHHTDPSGLGLGLAAVVQPGTAPEPTAAAAPTPSRWVPARPPSPHASAVPAAATRGGASSAQAPSTATLAPAPALAGAHGATAAGHHHHRRPHQYHIAPQPTAQRSSRVYIEDLHIGEIRISASFAPKPYTIGSAAAAAAAAARTRAGPAAAASAAGGGGSGGSPSRDAAGATAAAAGAPPAADPLAAADGDDGDGGEGGGGGGGGLVDSAVRLIVSLAHLEGAWVTLRPFNLRYALMRHEALVQNMLRHYMSCALVELIKVVGSLDIFGDVARLLQALGVGVWHLLSMPVAGAMRGDPIKFAAGLLGGVGSMVRNVTYAASNSVVKASRRARTALSPLAPEPVRHYASGAHVDPHGHHHHHHQHHAGHGGGAADAAGAGGGAAGASSSPLAVYAGRTYGQRDLLLSTWEGYASIVQRVATQASRLSPGGTARELLIGGLGAVALPSIALLHLVEAAAASLRATVSPHGPYGGTAHGRGPYGRAGGVWPRVPRYVDPGAPLQRYCWLESLCRLLQQEVAGGAFAREHYVGGVRVSESSFALVTRQHLVLVASPPQRHAPDPRAAAVGPPSLVVPLEGLVLARWEVCGPGAAAAGVGAGVGVGRAGAAAGGCEARVSVAHVLLPGRGLASGLGGGPGGGGEGLSSGGGAVGGSGVGAGGDVGGGGTGDGRAAGHGVAGPGWRTVGGMRFEGGTGTGSGEAGPGLLSVGYRSRGQQQQQPQQRGSTAGLAVASQEGEGEGARPGGEEEGGLAGGSSRSSSSGGGGDTSPHVHMGTGPGVGAAGAAGAQGGPLLCVTTLDMSYEADAVRLVGLLEEVRQWHDGQRRAGGCRMIGF